LATICTLRTTKNGNFGITIGEVDEAGYHPLSTFIFTADTVRKVLDGKLDKITKAEFKPKPRK